MSILTHQITLVVHRERKICHQKWSATEGSKSSTWRERRTVDLALSAFALGLPGKKIAWFTDNTNVISIVHNGSRVEKLQSLALSCLPEFRHFS